MFAHPERIGQRRGAVELVDTKAAAEITTLANQIINALTND